MRIEGRSPQFIQSQSNTSIAEAAPASKTQELGQVGTAQPGVALPQDQYGSAKAGSQQDYKYNPSGTALQVPDTLRRADRTGGDLGTNLTESITRGSKLDGPSSPVLGETVTMGQKVRTGEKLGPPPGEAGDLAMPEAKMGGKLGPKPGFEGSPDNPTMGQKVRTGEKLGPPPGEAGDVTKPERTGNLEPKPGFEGSPDKPTVGQKLGPGPGQATDLTMPEATMGQKLGPKSGEPAPDKPTVGQKLGPGPGQASEEAGSWSWGKGESVPKPFADGLAGGEAGATVGEKLGSGPDPLLGASYATPPGAKDTEINVPKPEPKPDNSPWGKPVPEPKHPDMWKD